VGGDVDANSIDVSATTKVADWTVCELIRLYHGLSPEYRERTWQAARYGACEGTLGSCFARDRSIPR